MSVQVNPVTTMLPVLMVQALIVVCVIWDTQGASVSMILMNVQEDPVVIMEYASIPLAHTNVRVVSGMKDYIVNTVEMHARQVHVGTTAYVLTIPMGFIAAVRLGI